MALVCGTCDYSARRLIGNECDGCWKYRKRTGKPRPQRLIDKIEDKRWARAQRQFESETRSTWH